MASKEKVDIVRSDQFQEVDDELTRAMAELDSTIERVSLIFQNNSESASGADTPLELPESAENVENPESVESTPASAAAAEEAEPVDAPADKDASESL